MSVSSVPCNGCRRCCIGDGVRILPHEDASQWETVPHFLGLRHRMLAHKGNGECIYLGPDGCTIHDKPRPQLCEEMDCRRIAMGATFTQARALNIVRIWRRGKELLEEHGEPA